MKAASHTIKLVVAERLAERVRNQMDFLNKTRVRYQMLVSDADSSGLDD